MLKLSAMRIWKMRWYIILDFCIEPGCWLPWEGHWTWRWIYDQRKGAPCEQVAFSWCYICYPLCKLHSYNWFLYNTHGLFHRFISIPKDMGAFNCGAFVAGIVRVCTVNRTDYVSTNHTLTGFTWYASFFFFFKGCTWQCRFPSCCNCPFCSSGGAAATSDYHFD